MKHKRITELRWPGLWRGCVGAWNPGLGPTGLTLRDWSGSGYHGTLVNGPVFGPVFGKQSLTLDGSDDRVDVSSPTRLRTQNFSLSLWVRLTTQSNSTANLIDMSHANLQGWTLQSLNATTSSQYQFVWHTGSGFTGLTSPGVTIPIGLWTHVAVAKQGSEAFGWVNGIRTQYASGLNANVNYNPANPNMAIGNFTFGSGRNTSGAIAELRGYDYGFNDATVTLLSRCPGIAYELAPRRRSSVQVAAFNRRRRLLIGAGS